MSDLSAILLSIISAIISGTAVAFLSPRFAHSVWKKQKLREQQVAVAEQFAKLFSDLHIAGNLRPVPSLDEGSMEIESRFHEQRALFILAFVLFDWEDTLSFGIKLLKLINDNSHDFQALSSLRAEFLARMFAEALDISPEKITKRSAKLSDQTR